MKSHYLDMLHILNIIYKVIKTEYWPYRYYILILVLLYYTLELFTVTRLIRFAITLILILIYKYLHLYINSYNIKYFNIKLLIFLMYYNIIINPILYIVWLLELNRYKIEKILDKKIKNKYIYLFLISLIVNITTPFKYIFMKYYKMLKNFQLYTIFELLFIRIYGLIISVLIFSDIIKYLLNITGGIINLMIYIYLILYIINVLYMCYILFNFKLKYVNKILNITYVNNILNIKYIKTIYMLIFNYFNSMRNITIENICNDKIEVSLVGTLIKKVLKTNIKQLFFKTYILKIPSIWRNYIYLISLKSTVLVFGNSYIDYKNQYIITNNKINTNILYDIYYDVYHDIFKNICEIFILFESILYYKYYNLNKKTITSEDPYYEYVYNLYYLILKNILHFMWSFEYNIDKNKMTQLFVNKSNMCSEYGYNVYFNKECNDRIIPQPLYTYENYIKKLNNVLIDEKYDPVYECIHLLSNFIEKDWLYVKYQDNKELKFLNLLDLEYHKLFKINNAEYINDLAVLEKSVAQTYLLDLNNVILKIRQEWEHLNPLDIFKKRTVFFELIHHIKKKNAFI